jgi:hypothetical protein
LLPYLITDPFLAEVLSLSVCLSKSPALPSRIAQCQTPLQAPMDISISLVILADTESAGCMASSQATAPHLPACTVAFLARLVFQRPPVVRAAPEGPTTKGFERRARWRAWRSQS